MNIKYRYILIGVVLISVVGFGVFYFMSDSSVSPETNVPAQTAKIPTQKTSPAVPIIPLDDFNLELIEPTSLELVVPKSPITIRGKTRLDALITINEHVVEPNIEGWFQKQIDLKPGLNIIEVIASVPTGEQKSIILGVGFVPE